MLAAKLTPAQLATLRHLCGRPCDVASVDVYMAQSVHKNGLLCATASPAAHALLDELDAK